MDENGYIHMTEEDILLLDQPKNYKKKKNISR